MAKFITVNSKYAKSGIYEFSKEAVIPENERYKINIFASARYILYINEKYVCEGPCRGKKDVRYYDSVEVDLNKGINNIRVEVMHLTTSGQFATVFKNEKPILIFNAVSDNNEISSELSWKCSYRNGHEFFRANGYMDSIAPSEKVYADVSPDIFNVEKACDYEYDFSGAIKADWGCIQNDMFLRPRPIPMIYPNKKVCFKIVKKGDDFIEFDAGEYVCAKVEVTAAPESDIKIIYSECYTFPDGKKKRNDTSGELYGMHDEVHTGKNVFTFKTYWFRAFRFIRIETKNPDQAIKEICAKRINYPLDITSEFKCSDEIFNKMYDISINTMLCCMHEIFVDCPHYEQQQYQMDTAIEANVSMRMSNDVRLIKKCIDDLAGSQISSGLLCANYPNTGVQIIPGFSFFWIFLLRDYLDYSKDSDFVYEYLGVMDKILNYFDNTVRKQGYISTSCYWDFVDWVENWDKGVPNIDNGDIITVYNMYYLRALKDAAYICEKLDKRNYSLEYTQRYEALKKTVNDLCFDGELYTDGNKNKNHSVHTIIWAVLCEIVNKEQAKKIMSHIFDDNISKVSFSMMFYLFRAIDKCDMHDLLPNMFDGWKRMIDYNCTTWCETYPENTRSECHAWSSAPLYEFMSDVLGVKCVFDDKIIISPKILNLDYAQGSVPTRYGDVKVEWKVKEHEFIIKIHAPENVSKVLITPKGNKYSFDEKGYILREKGY
ncbi:MAG: alpha-L-rhamnosidase C-terminal domain-containing protein [Clostridia bacterium]|nr:alpha-L-rhamnosidase C-terminal domain-containing protein [Clostridia bacterium]